MNEDETGRHTAITVEIAGESYTLRTDADAEHARRCAALVDARMRAISGDVSPGREEDGDHGGAVARGRALQASIRRAQAVARDGRSHRDRDRRPNQ